MTSKNNQKMSFHEKIYLVEIVKGLFITLKHALTNLFHRSGPGGIRTVEYPEQVKTVTTGFRGQHRLTRRDDGSPRCTACMLCATSCPADCITIVAAEHEDPTIEKYPLIYEIDELRCVFCGLCVEACPCDAIRMDTCIYDMADFTRESLIYKKDLLLNS
ncbi:NADH-quinone oxidoreductase subunit I [bacterium]|nr:NADH-quinone oxidoreductase subunit I [bacterium]